MGTESKGRAWFGKIYNKLETILVEVDTFTAQSTLCLKSSDPSRWKSVRGEPEEAAEDRSSWSSDLQQHHSRLAFPRCESPFDPPSHQNFNIPGIVRVEKRVEDLSACSDGEILSGATLLQDYCDGSLTSPTTLGDDGESRITDEESQITNTLIPQESSAGDPSGFPAEESVEEVRVESGIDFVSTVSQSTQNHVGSFGTVVTCNDDPILAVLEISMDDSNIKLPDVQDNVATITSGNLDDVIDGKSDVAPLDAKALNGIAFQESPSYVEDNALYAVGVRTKKLRSVKRRILDTLTSKRQREKEYEQLAIWFGDADMGSDLATGEDSKKAIDSKSSQVLKSEDSQWEVL